LTPSPKTLLTLLAALRLRQQQRHFGDGLFPELESADAPSPAQVFGSYSDG